LAATGTGGYIKRDDGLIGPFSSREEAEKDARETLGVGLDQEG
jgi:hypothetical protein